MLQLLIWYPTYNICRGRIQIIIEYNKTLNLQDYLYKYRSIGKSKVCVPELLFYSRILEKTYKKCHHKNKPTSLNSNQILRLHLLSVDIYVSGFLLWSCRPSFWCYREKLTSTLLLMPSHYTATGSLECRTHWNHVRKMTIYFQPQ